MDVVDLTVETEIHPDDAGDYSAEVVLGQDRELRILQAALNSALENVADQQRALSVARQQLQAAQQAVADRRAHLIHEAESKVDWIGRKFPWDHVLTEKLASVFRIREFRPMQREAINAAMSRRDVLAVLPTGAGKSLLYQLAALVDGGLTVVVTPLVALMQDQTEQLTKLGVKACMMDSNSAKEEIDTIFKEVLPVASKTGVNKVFRSKRKTVGYDVTSWEPRDTSSCILYITPERVSKSKKLQTRLEVAYEQGRISRFCFDEAHCISQWGHDFRHDYAQLGILRRHFREVPIMALTATATSQVIEDIKKSLEIEPVLLRGSIDRPNLYYEVRYKTDALMEMIARVCLEECPSQAGIIYVLSRKDADRTAASLFELGVKCRPYHGDLSAHQRSETFSAWVQGRIRVVVATIAFGLGVNKLDCRFVIHSCVASSLIGLYQESGRAGRDGKPAKCIVFWHPADLVRMSSFVSDKGPNRLAMLYDTCRYAIASPRRKGGPDETPNRPRVRRCRRAMIAAAFDEEPPSRNKLCCDLCVTKETRTYCEVTKEAVSAVRIIQQFSDRLPDEKLTLNSMATDWGNSGPKGKRLRGENEAIPKNGLTKDQRLDILVQLVLDEVLEEYHVFGAYSTQGYVRSGRRASALLSGDLRVYLARVKVSCQSK